MDRGKLVSKEAYSRFNRKRNYRTISYVIFILFTILVLIGLYFGLSMWNLSAEQNLIDLMILMVGASIAYILPVFFFLLGYRRVRLEIYENGFIPYSRPTRYVRQKKDLFIKWDYIAEIEKIETRKEGEWIYAIVTRSKKGYMIGHFAFENGGNAVLKKLESVERDLRNRGRLQKQGKFILYDTG
jgi:CRISPR/Cas system-associated protein Cas10 (large subunit of type III CRISPR-Cas system)